MAKLRKRFYYYYYYLFVYLFIYLFIFERERERKEIKKKKFINSYEPEMMRLFGKNKNKQTNEQKDKNKINK